MAVFAGLAEVAMTVGLATVSQELQSTLLWFVVGFPLFLVALFFVTLNFNHTVLYAPQDFSDETNFVKLISPEPPVDISHGVSVDVDRIASQPFTEMKTVQQIRETVMRLYDTADAEIYATNIGYRPDDRASRTGSIRTGQHSSTRRMGYTDLSREYFPLTAQRKKKRFGQ